MNNLQVPVTQNVVVTQINLNAWRSFVEQGRTQLTTLRQLLARRQDAAALGLLDALHENALLLELDLGHAGAAPPGTAPPRFVVPPGMRDTPATRQLLGALRSARAAAEAVDAERYHAVLGEAEAGPYVLWLDRLLMDVEAGTRGPSGGRSGSAADATGAEGGGQL